MAQITRYRLTIRTGDGELKKVGMRISGPPNTQAAKDELARQQSMVNRSTGVPYFAQGEIVAVEVVGANAPVPQFVVQSADGPVSVNPLSI